MPSDDNEAHHPAPAGLCGRLGAALDRGSNALYRLASAGPRDERDQLGTLLLVHDLHLAPLEEVGARSRHQHHPVVAALKARLETALLDRLDAQVALDDCGAGDDVVAGIRAVAAVDLVPPVYDWLATDASFEETLAFIALEGGPDGGFDDLVAVCQVGLAGEPKLELARNYWDEMGRGAAADVHTELHRDLRHALELPLPPRSELPLEALQRSALLSTLATNRHLQPELVGALGLVELQAGPRCRRVVKALRRLGAPPEALAFYEEHATADPRHGKDWLDHVVRPLAADPRWAPGMLRGARLRAAVNRAFFSAAGERFRPSRRALLAA